MADDECKLAGRLPRNPESRTLESPAFKTSLRVRGRPYPSARPLKAKDHHFADPPTATELPPRLANNTLDCDAGGKFSARRFHQVQRGSPVINVVLDALKTNTKIEALYIQNFEDGFFDEQLERLTEVLKLKRIWCLNVGENFVTT